MVRPRAKASSPRASRSSARMQDEIIMCVSFCGICTATVNVTNSTKITGQGQLVEECGVEHNIFHIAEVGDMEEVRIGLRHAVQSVVNHDVEEVR